MFKTTVLVAVLSISLAACSFNDAPLADATGAGVPADAGVGAGVGLLIK